MSDARNRAEERDELVVQDLGRWIVAQQARLAGFLAGALLDLHPGAREQGVVPIQEHSSPVAGDGIRPAVLRQAHSFVIEARGIFRSELPAALRRQAFLVCGFFQPVKLANGRGLRPHRRAA